MTQKLLMANKKPLRRERNMQRTSSELSNTNTKIKVIGKKIGKKRAIFNVPKSHQHMSHKVAQNMTEAEIPAKSSKTWYLPHHPVFHPQKAHKIKAVVDAAF